MYTLQEAGDELAKLAGTRLTWCGIFNEKHSEF
jgi:hypothetical protein